ncbi:YxiJ family protein [Gorillibacterium massiliense]|uniref:YxiJ family protein n=1 Tax=Gorillibacterium massiliense TaxID=1280390 RepID=UPI000592E02E|nr:YxiJ family protein [Gorillibacterium massiliense]
MKNEISEIYSKEYLCISLYLDIIRLQKDFEEMFLRYVPNESINADFDVYESFIIGLASGGIDSRLGDALERYKLKVWLNKSFFEWFPKYRFLEPYDLSEYVELNNAMKVVDNLRRKLINLIRLKENGDPF